MKKLLKKSLLILLLSFMGLTLPLNTYAISQEEGQGVHYNFIQQVERQTTVPDGYVGIYTPDDLNNIRNGMTDHYILMNDIDLAVFENWEPIGNSTANTFKGIFDGNGYAVRNTCHGDGSLDTR